MYAPIRSPTLLAPKGRPPMRSNDRSRSSRAFPALSLALLLASCGAKPPPNGIFEGDEDAATPEGEPDARGGTGGSVKKDAAGGSGGSAEPDAAVEPDADWPDAPDLVGGDAG